MKLLFHCMRLLLLIGGLLVRGQAAGVYQAQPEWIDTLQTTRRNLELSGLGTESQVAEAQNAWAQFKHDFPCAWDWLLQDAGQEAWRWLLPRTEASFERRLLETVLADTDANGFHREQRDGFVKAKVPAGDSRWLKVYAAACEKRRAARLKTAVEKSPRVVFVKRRTIRPSFFAYTEGQSDAQHERHFLPGSELCVLDLHEKGLGTVRTLLASPEGVIRDPAVSWDAQRIVFAWKKSLDEDDYHLYEHELSTGKTRQLTFGKGVADYEPAFLPNGDLVFSSTRCVQTVDCWWTEVSNLYRCDSNGRYLRRLGFDQVHTVYPQVLDDGRVIYTRWDYNDRGQIFPQPLFQMNMDGTGQVEFYGNSSWFPTTIAHARGIPGTQKVMAVLCGHHSAQAGKLAIIDPARGRQENSGVQLVAPVRETPAERIDSYGQDGPLWQYPFPISERECLTAFAPLGWEHYRPGDADFAIYWMDINGRRELLTWDSKLPCSQPVALAPRARPNVLASHVDYAQARGTYYMQDVYAGTGLQSVPRGTIRKLRVIALRFRPAGVGENYNSGPAGGALVSTPISIGNGCWDVKAVLGEATVHEDGSAYFTVPARTPVYFQALDERGFAVQTMRSWSTVQPGERMGCTGCHDSRNTTAPRAAGDAVSLALKAGPEPLSAPEHGFSFRRDVQPILDRHCTHCHDQRPHWVESPHPVTAPQGNIAAKKSFSLLPETNLDPVAKREWSDAYLALTGARPGHNSSPPGAFHGNPDASLVNWVSAQSIPEPLAPYSAGAIKSELMGMLQRGHNDVRLSPAELRILACWIDLGVPYCGNYQEANAWSEEEKKRFEHYLQKRKRMEDLDRQNIEDLLSSRTEAH